MMDDEAPEAESVIKSRYQPFDERLATYEAESINLQELLEKFREDIGEAHHDDLTTLLASLLDHERNRIQLITDVRELRLG